MQMFNPGRNKVKVQFFDRSETVDTVNDVGEYDQKPKLICTDWVELIPTTGREFLQNKKSESEMTYRFKMRKRKDIEVNDYVEFNGIRAEIIYIAPFIEPTIQDRYMEVVVLWHS